MTTPKSTITPDEARTMREAMLADDKAKTALFNRHDSGHSIALREWQSLLEIEFGHLPKEDAPPA